MTSARPAAPGPEPDRSGRLTLAALLLFVAGRCLVPMDETDLFFNLRLGAIVLETGHVPRENLLSFTWPDFRDVNLAWLFQCLLVVSYRAGGIAGTVLLKTAFVVGTFAVLWRVARRRGGAPALTAIALALGAWAAEPRFVERPHLVTFLGLALTLVAVERAEAGRPRALWLLVPAGLVWVNANSCFFLAPSILFLYAAGARLDGRRAEARRATLVALALAPLVLATPSGTGALEYIANHFRMPSLRPLQEYRTASWPVDGPFFFLAAALAVAALAPGPRPLRHLLPVLALAILGALRIRFVAEFAILAAPALTALASARLARLTAARPRAPARLSAASAALLVVLAVAPRVADVRDGGRFLDLSIEHQLVPLEAIRFATERGLRDRMYNDMEVGSYLTWDGWPRYRVFQDPRINGYPDSFHSLLRRADLSRPEWQATLDQHAVTSALVTYPDVNPRAALFDPARWALVYRSPEALVFAARRPEHQALIAERELPITFTYDPEQGTTPVAVEPAPPGSSVRACEWRRRLGDFHIERGDADNAWRAYRAAVGATGQGLDCLSPSAREAVRTTASALALRQGEAALAIELARGSRSPDARVTLGFALLAAKDPSRALPVFDELVALPPSRVRSDALLGRALALEALRDPRATAAYEALKKEDPTRGGPAAAKAAARRATNPLR